MDPTLDRGPRDDVPWFHRQPRLTVVVAIVLFAAVLVLRLSVGDAEDAINLLHSLPVALIALAFGRRAGIIAGLVAVGLVVVWALATDADLTPLGWTSRVVPLLLLGGLLGDASDRLAAAHRRGRELEAAAERQRAATEVNDTLVQGMAAAKWSIEAGRYDAGLKTLTDTLTLGHELVSKLMREADMGLDGQHRPPVRD